MVCSVSVVAVFVTTEALYREKGGISLLALRSRRVSLPHLQGLCNLRAATAYNVLSLEKEP